MKSLIQHINGTLNRSHSECINEWKLNDQSSKFCMFYPKNIKELINIIKDRLIQNSKKPYLLDIDTSLITDMSGLFSNFESKFFMGLYEYGEYSEIEELDLHSWNMSNVTNIECMFHNCYNLKTINIAGWNIIKVQNMNGLFDTCVSLENFYTTKLDTRNVKNMPFVFHDCRKIKYLDLSTWNTSKVDNFRYMFDGCENLTEIKGIGDWKLSKRVGSWGMEHMFSNCPVTRPSWYIG